MYYVILRANGKDEYLVKAAGPGLIAMTVGSDFKWTIDQVVALGFQYVASDVREDVIEGAKYLKSAYKLTESEKKLIVPGGQIIVRYHNPPL